MVAYCETRLNIQQLRLASHSRLWRTESIQMYKNFFEYFKSEKTY